MDYPPAYSLRSTLPVFTSEFDFGEQGSKSVVFEVAELRRGSFGLALIASTAIGKERNMVGWVGFYTAYNHNFGAAMQDGIEIGETKVDPSFFKKGIGSMLVQVALAVAKDLGKAVYLRPQRPGDGLAKEYRDEEFPLSTPKIRDFYLSLGFRDLSASERFRHAKATLEDDLATELCHAGLNPATLGFGSWISVVDRRRKSFRAISDLPIRVKLDALLRHFEAEKKTTYMNQPHYNPKSLVKERIHLAMADTRAYMIARDDLKLPQLMRGKKRSYPPRPAPPARVMPSI